MSSLQIAASAVQARTRISHHIYQTPLIPARQVGHDHHAKVLFKSENFQLTGSFKLRGAVPSHQTCKAVNDVWADILGSVSGICIINLNMETEAKAFALTILMPSFSMINADGGGLSRCMYNRRDKRLAWGSLFVFKVLEWE
jgi:cysteine synthase